MTHGVGLTDRLVMMGCAGPKYLARHPNGRAGGYHIEATPHELAEAIVAIRTCNEPIRRVLCVGTRTFGAERAVVEALGVLDVSLEVKGEGPELLANVSALEGVKVGRGIGGVYDLVIVAGNEKVSAEVLWKHTRKRGFVLCLGVGYRAEQPESRAAWMAFRNGGHLKLVQTGADFGCLGVGLVQITFHKEGWDAVQEQGAAQLDDGEQASNGEAVEQGDAEGKSPAEEGQEGEGVKPWSRAHAKCVKCGSVDKPHVSKGLCRTCYAKRGKA